VPETAPVPELPQPSPELILILALVQAHVATMPRKRKDAFLLAVNRSLGLQEASYNILRFRPRTEDRAVYRAMAHARAWWSQAMAAVVRMG
jgi:hypothetical protein